MTNDSKTTSSIRLTVGSDFSPGFVHNKRCDLDLTDFGRMNTFRLQTAGVREACYLPNEYQLNFNAGQYVTFGAQKAWKRRPAINHKTKLLEYLSKPTATPEAVLQILRLRIGLEVSACTSNAQRITLEEALELAFPSRLAALRDACSSGDARFISTYATELGATGINQESHLLLFWPPSHGFNDVLKISNPPKWSSLLKDTPYSSCFGVLSPRCLTFGDKDNGRRIERLCSKSVDKWPRSVLHTTIELNPEDCLQPPLKAKTEIKLADGSISIRNDSVPAQLAFYSGKSGLLDAVRRKRMIHRELINLTHTSPRLVSVCILDRP